MSLVKHIEQIKAFIIQNMFFFGQLFLLAATFVIWKLAEALFSFNTSKSNTEDKELTVNEEESGFSAEERSAPNEDERSAHEEKKSVSTENEDENTRNLKSTTKIHIENDKENVAKQLTDKKNE